MITGRLAPTPSGRMHLGNAFSALMCWLSARSQGGRVLLRMENLDPLRTTQAHAQALRDDLHWLGLNWDEETPPQGTRSHFYRSQIEKLDALSLTYPCFCSRAQLHAANAPHAADGNYVYSGTCRRLTPQQAAQLAQSRPPALRVRVPNETVHLQDGLQGHYEENLMRDCGDYILRRSDGVYAYQLAAPADDGASGVTEVVRGRDLLSSAPRQIWLMRTLGYAPPRYIHLPLLLAPGGRRLAKRDKDLDLGALRARGLRAQQLVGLLAQLSGIFQFPTAVSAHELIGEFNWNKINKNDITIDSSIMERLENL